MQPTTKSMLQIEAFKFYIVGGLAIVLAALWWLSPAPAAKPLPVGQLEQAYREEITSLFGQQAATECQYWAKHLYMTCGTVDVSPTQLRERGWQVETTAGNGSSYLREQWRLKLACAGPGSESCKPELWFVGGAKQ
jgi:hypothetical protein